MYYKLETKYSYVGSYRDWGITTIFGLFSLKANKSKSYDQILKILTFLKKYRSNYIDMAYFQHLQTAHVDAEAALIWRMFLSKKMEP